MTAFEIFAATIKALFGFDAEQAAAEFALISGLQKPSINTLSNADMLELRDAYRKASRIGHRGTLNRAGRDAVLAAFWNGRNNCAAVVEMRRISRESIAGDACFEGRILARQERLELAEGW
jgi:hypothetical protein